MSSLQRYTDFKPLPPGPKRRERVRQYLSTHRGIRERAANRASVGTTMVSKVLHGSAVSSKVEEALMAEEVEVAQVA